MRRLSGSARINFRRRCASPRDRISQNERSRVAVVKQLFASPFFPSFCNSLAAAGSSVSRAPAASGSRSCVSRAIRRDYRPYFFRAVIPRISWKLLFPRLFLSPDQLRLVARINRSLAWRELRFPRLSDVVGDAELKGARSRQRRSWKRSMQISFLLSQ